MAEAKIELFVNGRLLEFQPVQLMFREDIEENVFSRKNNKTLISTLQHRRYASLLPVVTQTYPNKLDTDLGAFLLELKSNGDAFYLKFLNKYGDRKYCKFSISQYLNLKGLYCFTVNQKIKYIGRTNDPFGKRINQGYGNVHPKNCYIDGQSTNCRLNALISEARDQVELFFCAVQNSNDINVLENQLIHQLAPKWNF